MSATIPLLSPTALVSVTSSVASIAVGSSITSNPASLSLHPTKTAFSPVLARVWALSPISGIKSLRGGATGVAVFGATSSKLRHAGR